MISMKPFRAMIFKISQVVCFTVAFSGSYILLLPLASDLLLIYLPHHHSTLFISNIFYSSNCKVSFFSHGFLLFYDLHAHTKIKVCGFYERKHYTCLSEAGLLLTVISRPITAKCCNREGHWRWWGRTRRYKMGLNKPWLCTWNTVSIIKMKRKL